MALLVSVICLAGIQQHSVLDLATGQKLAALICLLLVWHMHLALSSTRWVISTLAVSVTAWEVSTRLDRVSSSLQFAAAFLAYFAVWTFSAHQRKPGLQPVATMALVTCAAVLASPTVAVGCLILALGSFALHRHQALGGRFGFALLLLTPATLCTLAIFLLGLLGAGSLVAYPLSEEISTHASIVPFSIPSALRGELLVPLALVGARLVSRRAGTPDVMFLLMIVAGTLSTQLLPALCNLRAVWLMSLGVSGYLWCDALAHPARPYVRNLELKGGVVSV
jgi:hypothetical protein